MLVRREDVSDTTDILDPLQQQVLLFEPGEPRHNPGKTLLTRGNSHRSTSSIRRFVVGAPSRSVGTVGT